MELWNPKWSPQLDLKSAMIPGDEHRTKYFIKLKNNHRYKIQKAGSVFVEGNEKY